VDLNPHLPISLHDAVLKAHRQLYLLLSPSSRVTNQCCPKCFRSTTITRYFILVRTDLALKLQTSTQNVTGPTHGYPDLGVFVVFLGLSPVGYRGKYFKTRR